MRKKCNTSTFQYRYLNVYLGINILEKKTLSWIYFSNLFVN